MLPSYFQKYVIAALVQVMPVLESRVAGGQGFVMMRLADADAAFRGTGG